MFNHNMMSSKDFGATLVVGHWLGVLRRKQNEIARGMGSVGSLVKLVRLVYSSHRLTDYATMRVSLPCDREKYKIAHCTLSPTRRKSSMINGTSTIHYVLTNECPATWRHQWMRCSQCSWPESKMRDSSDGRIERGRIGLSALHCSSIARRATCASIGVPNAIVT